MIKQSIFDRVDRLILELIYVEEKSIEEKVILDTLLNTENFGEWVFDDPSFFGYFERRNALNFYYKWKVMVDRKELKHDHNMFTEDSEDTAEHIPKNLEMLERPEGIYCKHPHKPTVEIPVLNYKYLQKCGAVLLCSSDDDDASEFVIPKQDIKKDRPNWKKLWKDVWDEVLMKTKRR